MLLLFKAFNLDNRRSIGLCLLNPQVFLDEQEKIVELTHTTRTIEDDEQCQAASVVPVPWWWALILHEFR